VLQQAVQLCDTEAGLLRDLGFAYRDAGDRDGARRALSRARAIDPADPSIGEALDAL
jgi:Flp pilus assembly protein TadD